MLQLNALHHIAVICSDYEKSRYFYTNVLGLTAIAERYRTERDSYKLDLGLNGDYLIELFSFPNPPKRVTDPEAAGLRHIAFAVDDIEASVAALHAADIEAEEIRTDQVTQKRFIFFKDPDGLPIELYEK